MNQPANKESDEIACSRELIIKNLGIRSYLPVWEAMKAYAQSNIQRPDELWVLEHEPVYTRGIRCKEFPDAKASHIPVITVDRGGLMTYHGPGQVILYGLVDIDRAGMNIKQVVNAYEQCVINLLAFYQIDGERIEGAPGVYVKGKKIASIGIRVKNRKTYHGLSVNLDMDLVPFDWINTCGFSRLEVTQLRSLTDNYSTEDAIATLVKEFSRLFNYQQSRCISDSEGCH